MDDIEVGAFPDGEAVEVGGRRYAIVVQDRESQRMLEGAYGTCDSERVIIALREGLVDELGKVVVMHELIHAVDIAIAGGEGSLSEGQVNGLSEVLLGAMRSAPALVEWMVE